jgi:hypothetical protein
MGGNESKPRILNQKIILRQEKLNVPDIDKVNKIILYNTIII